MPAGRHPLGSESRLPDAAFPFVAAQAAEPCTWSDTGPPATPRYSRSASLLDDGRVLAIGGQHSRVTADSRLELSMLKSAEVYDPATRTWTAVPDDTLPGRLNTFLLRTGYEQINQLAAAYAEESELLPAGT